MGGTPATATTTTMAVGVADQADVAVTGLPDPTVLADVPIVLRAVGAFVLVLLFGGIVLSVSDGFVHRGADAVLERPLISVVYGVLAQVSLVLFGAYASGQLVRLSPVTPTVGTVGLWAVVGATLALSAFGLAVVGTAITDITGARQVWPGLAIGAAIGAAAWLVPPFGLALLVWLLVVSIGVGGPARVWLHDSAEQRSTAQRR